MVLKRIVRLLMRTASSSRAIARDTGKSHNTITKYRRRLDESGLSFEEVNKLTSDALDRLLNTNQRNQRKSFIKPDWAEIHKDLANPKVTLSLAHAEYVGEPGGAYMSESVFRRRYKEYQRGLGISMRMPRRPGWDTYIDYSGKRPFYVDPATNEKIYVELFVAVLGSSRKTFATCTMTQQIPDFLAAQEAMWAFYGAVTQNAVPDNLKSAVTKVGREGHKINETYQHFCEHYDVTVMPTRARSPKDKAAVESGVLVVQRWILARLRHYTFYCLQSLNAKVAELLEPLNAKPMRSRDNKSRNELFEELDRPVMRPLPPTPYEYTEWKHSVTVQNDYHVFFDGSWYSVPFALVRKKVEIGATVSAIKIYYCHELVATHERSTTRDNIVTRHEHQPDNHRAYAEDQTLDMLAWARDVGPDTHLFVQAHLEHHGGSRSIRGFSSLRRLARDEGKKRVELACGKALRLHAVSVPIIKSMLARNLEAVPIEDANPMSHPAAAPENVRGPDIYA